MILSTTSTMDKLGFFAGFALIVIYGFTVIAPYVFPPPHQTLLHAVEQAQNTTQNLLLMLYSFLYGTSVGSRKKDDALANVASTAYSQPVVSQSTTTINNGTEPTP